MLEAFIAAAKLHAATEHHVTGRLGITEVDQILDRERGGQAVEAVVPCYGAWFGQLVVDRLAGSWLGLSEPVPPRICVSGLAYSPFDAVARRLSRPSAPTLQTLLEQLLATASGDSPYTGAAVVTQNQVRWNELASHARFVNVEVIPPDRQQAQAALDPWLQTEGVEGKRMLCLAAGGGTHAPLHAVAGAMVTVIDFSEALLSVDRQLADRYQLSIETLCCSMDALPSALDRQFDIVLQPTSLCYVPDPQTVYAALARVLRPGGLYIVQHKSSTSLRTTRPHEVGYQLQWMQRDGRMLPPNSDRLTHREAGTIEFAHSDDVLIGGLCRAGFVIEEYSQPPRGDAWAEPGSPEHRALFAPPYFKMKARRT